MLSRKLKRIALYYNGTIITDKLKTYDFVPSKNQTLEVKTFLESQEKCKFDIVFVDYNGVCTVDDHNTKKFSRLLAKLERVEV